MYQATGHIMCIQCSRCLATFACRLNILFKTPSQKYDGKNGRMAMACPANFNYVANCQRCYE